MKQHDQDILEFVLRGLDHRDEKRFNDLALKEFERQYNVSAPYKEFCKKVNVVPETIAHWEEIPAVSSFAFKKTIIDSLPAEKAEQLYLDSRIVQLKKKKERKYRDKWAVPMIRTGNTLLAKAHLFPDIEKMKILFMVPSPKMAPLMEMAIGMEHLRTEFGTPDSRFLISPLGLDIKTLLGALKNAEKTGEPLALIGATFGLVLFFDACEKEGIRFSLPEGSRICDTGGYMGRYTGCSKEEFFKKCAQVLGVEEDFCINVLWICENSTIYFDTVLKNLLSGVKKRRYKKPPPWARTIAVDTREFKRLPKGEIGLLRHYDLTNRLVGFAVQTDNLGFETEDGFEVIGKWNKKTGNIDIDYSVCHPGGWLATKMIKYVMRRKLSKVGRIHSRLK
ncbi:MAG: acyl-protein synthetase [Proteobacteria bacterium]|nr:acyl-protein synthetase [Pseudomonadota bacterium]MBU4068858.1 acyl-protein synthetase [Pseudomonadota bacterium]